MALENVTVPYELLVRFDSSGVPVGAHVQYRQIVTLDGTVLKDEPLPAEPLTVDSSFPTSALLTEATQAALARITELEAQVASLETQLNG